MQKLPNSAWVDRCTPTWKPFDGLQKIHYSQQSANGKPGAHSRTIAINGFMEDMAPLSGRSLDVMLEVKDKNLSAIKCMLCLAEDARIDGLECEWNRYKYAVLEHSPHHYQQIRSLLKDKTRYPAVASCNLIESALEHPIDSGSAANAAMHAGQVPLRENAPMRPSASSPSRPAISSRCCANGYADATCRCFRSRPQPAPESSAWHQRAPCVARRKRPPPDRSPPVPR